MTILERVLAAMKTSYAKYGFKSGELSKLAEAIIKGANLKDESTDENITAALTANEGYAQVMQSVYNRGVSETSEKYKDYIPKPKEDPKPTPTPTSVPQPVRNQAFTLEDVKKLAQGMVDEALKPYKERDERNRLQSILEGNSKLKGVSKTFIKRYHLDKEEDADKVADEIVNDWTEIKQGLVQDGTFVAAPSKSEQGSNDEDFRKMMEDSAKRIQEKQAAVAASAAGASAQPQK